MTNHPRRARGDNEQNEQPDHEPAPPVHTPNGHGAPAGLQPNAAKIIGQTVAEVLSETLPPMLAQALSDAARPQYCATCLAERLNWEIAHEADLKAAIGQMQIAAQAYPPGDPRLAQLNPFMFLAAAPAAIAGPCRTRTRTRSPTRRSGPRWPGAPCTAPATCRA